MSFDHFLKVRVKPLCVGVRGDYNVLPLSCKLFSEVGSELFLEFFFSLILRSEMSLLSALAFNFWVFGAFWIASRVFTKAELILHKPNCFCCFSEGGSVSSRLLGCGVKVTFDLWILWVLFTNWW